MKTSTTPQAALRALCLLLLMGSWLVQAPAAHAQSELAVPPGVGTLNDAIENDTNRPEDRVYVLQRGAYYGITRELNNETFVLRIKAAAGEGTRPVIYPAPDNTGAVPGSRYIRLVEDAYFEGLYFLAVDPSQGVKGIPVAVNGEGQRLVIDNCVIEGGRSRHWEINAADTKIYVRNSQFRNQVRTDASSNARPFDYRTVQADTLYIENTSFLNVNGYLIRYDGPVLEHFFFNHNTVYTTNRELTTNALATQTIEYVVTNNLFVNPYALGQAPPDEGDEPNGVLKVDSLDTGIENGFTEGDRRIVFTNNAILHTQELLDFYEARTNAGDPLVARGLIHPSSQQYIDANEHARAENNTVAVVNFANPPSMDSYLAWYEAYRDGAAEPPFYAFGADTDLFPAEQPLPENLAYAATDVAFTAGTGGFPLGDLNWFPEQKEAWIAAGGGSGSVVSTETPSTVTGTLGLRGTYPNPFSGTTTVAFDLAVPAQVSVRVFDVLGRNVLTVPAQTVAAGSNHRVTLDATGLPAGLYLYRVTAEAGGVQQVKTGTITQVK